MCFQPLQSVSQAVEVVPGTPAIGGGSSCEGSKVLKLGLTASFGLGVFRV